MAKGTTDHREHYGTEIEVWAVGAGGFGEDDGAGALPEYRVGVGGFVAGVCAVESFVDEWV